MLFHFHLAATAAFCCRTISRALHMSGYNRLLALGGVRRAGAKRFERAVDGLVDRVPLGGRARF
jgi:hypothetical protein